MTHGAVAATPDADADARDGWRRAQVDVVRAAVRVAGPPGERIEWGPRVSLRERPALLIGAEDTRVLFGFWHGVRLQAFAPGLKPDGRYQMAAITLRPDASIEETRATRPGRIAIAPNAHLGDPTARAAR